MPLTSHPAETRIVLENVSWQTFEALLAEDGPLRGRLAYLEGTLEIMGPSFGHEDLKSTLGTLIEAYAQEMAIDMKIAGATTLKRQLKRRSLEPDESYYVQNEARVRGKTEIVLGQDPPPDLAIEIQITRSALDKLDIYAALGVPEFWLWEGDRLRVYWLEASGKSTWRRYPAPASPSPGCRWRSCYASSGRPGRRARRAWRTTSAPGSGRTSTGAPERRSPHCLASDAESIMPACTRRATAAGSSRPACSAPRGCRSGS